MEVDWLAGNSGNCVNPLRSGPLKEVGWPVQTIPPSINYNQSIGNQRGFRYRVNTPHTLGGVAVRVMQPSSIPRLTPGAFWVWVSVHQTQQAASGSERTGCAAHAASSVTRFPGFHRGFSGCGLTCITPKQAASGSERTGRASDAASIGTRSPGFRRGLSGCGLACFTPNKPRADRQCQ